LSQKVVGVGTQGLVVWWTYTHYDATHKTI